MLIRLIPWVVSVLLFGAFELIFYRPKSFFTVSFFFLILFIFSVWQISRRSLEFNFWRFLIPSFFFVSGSFLFISILEGHFFKHFVAFALAFFLAIYLENVYVYWHEPKKFLSYSTINISGYFNIVILFIFCSSIYWFIIFLGWPLSIGAILIFFLAYFLTYQMLTFHEFRMKERIHYLYIVPLIVTEIFLAVGFLPTSVYMNAALVTVSYYLLIGITKNHLLNMLHAKVIRRYLGIFILCLAILFVSAKYS